MDLILVVFKEDGQRREFPIHRTKTVIGRGDDCELQVPLGTISRHHCEIAIEDNTALLKDAGSSNGTYHNNQRVTVDQPLMPGDHIRIGPVTFTVVIDGEPTQIKPVRTILGEEISDRSRNQSEDSGTVDIEPKDDLPVAEELDHEHIPADDALSALQSLTKPKA